MSAATVSAEMKSEAQRGVFGSWLRKVRTAQFENVPKAISALQREMGYGIPLSVWAEMEAGTRLPSDEQRQYLTRFFDSEPVPTLGATPQGDIAHAVAAQTAAIELLTEQQRRQNDLLDQFLAILRGWGGSADVDELVPVLVGAAHTDAVTDEELAELQSRAGDAADMPRRSPKRSRPRSPRVATGQ